MQEKKSGIRISVIESTKQNANPKFSDCAACFRNFQPIVTTAAISSMGRYVVAGVSPLTSKTRIGVQECLPAFGSIRI